MKKCGNLAEYPGKKWSSNTPVDEVQSPESETLHHGEPSSWSELKYRAMWQWRTLATHSQKGFQNSWTRHTHNLEIEALTQLEGSDVHFWLHCVCSPPHVYVSLRSTTKSRARAA